jgi:hypothetical protein
MSVTGTTAPASVGADVTGWQHANGGAGELFSAAQAILIGSCLKGLVLSLLLRTLVRSVPSFQPLSDH